MNDDMQDAHHQQQLEQQEHVSAYGCPYCGKVYSRESTQCDGADIFCCSEIGHCEPITHEEQQAWT
jgi:predicted RNA-binding Zn-ribbon protein involved in translation (DUF1610 family)